MSIFIHLCLEMVVFISININNYHTEKIRPPRLICAFGDQKDK